LQQIAATIAGCVRPSDLLARHAGDEFAILLPFAGLQQAQNVAERVRQSVLRKAVAANGPGQNAQSLTVSLGVAEMKTNDTLDRLLGAAGAAVQQAKAEGGNRVHLAAS
jgi:diguanylate cyclase (GGDEF)-like protein